MFVAFSLCQETWYWSWEWLGKWLYRSVAKRHDLDYGAGKRVYGSIAKSQQGKSQSTYPCQQVDIVIRIVVESLVRNSRLLQQFWNSPVNKSCGEIILTDKIFSSSCGRALGRNQIGELLGEIKRKAMNRSRIRIHFMTLLLLWSVLLQPLS